MKGRTKGYIRMEIQEQSVDGDRGSFPSLWPFLSPTPSHLSLSCSISSPPLGPGTAASSSSSASGRTRCLKRWVWVRTDGGLGGIMEPGVSELGELEGPLALFHGHRPALPTASSIHASRGHQGSSAWPCPHGHVSVYPWPFLHLHKSKMLCK